MDYKKSGVDIEAADEFLKKNFLMTENKKVHSKDGDYAAVYKMNEQSYLATCCDGVGTKLLWALEDPHLVENLAQDLLAMSVNDLLCVGAQPSIFLDYIAFSETSLIKEGGLLSLFLKKLSSLCQQEGVLLLGGETAQMSGLYANKHFDLSGFAIGFMRPEEFIHPRLVQQGDQLWGWKSSGPHANGFTLLRSLFSMEKDQQAIESFCQPTRLYLQEMKELKKLLVEQPEKLHTAYHITGGSLKNLLRAQGENEFGFRLNSWGQGDEPWLESVREKIQSPKILFETFNMGYGFCVCLDGDYATEKSQCLQEIGLDYLGDVIPEKKVVYNNNLEIFA